MDGGFPVNRVEHLLGALENDVPANVLLFEFTNTAITFTEEPVGEAPEMTAADLDATLLRLFTLAIGDALREGAYEVHFEPLNDRVAIFYRFADGTAVERDSPPKRIWGQMLRAARAQLATGERLSVDGKPINLAFFDTLCGQGVSLTVDASRQDVGESAS